MSLYDRGQSLAQLQNTSQMVSLFFPTHKLLYYILMAYSFLSVGSSP